MPRLLSIFLLALLALVSLVTVRAQAGEGDAAAVQADGPLGDEPAAAAAADAAPADEDADIDVDPDAEIDDSAAPERPREPSPEEQENNRLLQAAFVKFLLKGTTADCKAELESNMGKDADAVFSPECQEEMAKVRARARDG